MPSQEQIDYQIERYIKRAGDILTKACKDDVLVNWSNENNNLNTLEIAKMIQAEEHYQNKSMFVGGGSGHPYAGGGGCGCPCQDKPGTGGGN